jgi:hypothetical protein
MGNPLLYILRAKPWREGSICFVVLHQLVMMYRPDDQTFVPCSGEWIWSSIPSDLDVGISRTQTQTQYRIGIGVV